MTIQLKEKHLCYALNLLKSESVETYLTTAFTVVNAIKNNTGDSDTLLSVDVSSDMIYTVWVKAGRLPEVFCKSINEEIKQLLLPQIVGDTSPEALVLLDKLNALTNEYILMLNESIAQTRAWALLQ